MFSEINLNSLPGFSRLFIDYLGNKPFFANRFPLNNQLFSNNEILTNRALSFNGRNQAYDCINQSMQRLNLSESQASNLSKIKQNNTLVVVTGQQVGFLGGPEYTFLKILSSVSLTEKLALTHKNLDFVPVFWLEDNDHDNFEASHIYVYNEHNEAKEFSCCPICRKDDPTSVSGLKFGEDITEIIEEIINYMPPAQFKNDISGLLRDIYKPGRNWSDSFEDLIQYVFSSTGLLIIKASQIMKQGLFSPYVRKELDNPGAVLAKINEANGKLIENGYHLQAKAYELNLFYHENGQRYKIRKGSENGSYEAGGEIFNKQQLLDLLDEKPDSFSPSVILRPVFQDGILPNVAYIGGPSEVGYIAQIKEVYDYFEIPMAAIISRHSATILDKRTLRFLEKDSLEPLFFMRQFQEIEHILNQKMLMTNAADDIENATKQITAAFNNLTDLAKNIDPTLEASCNGIMHKVNDQLALLEKKIISAERKKHSHLYQKYLETSNLVYPKNSLQERLISPLNFISKCGVECYLHSILEICRQSKDKHYFVQLGEY